MNKIFTFAIRGFQLLCSIIVLGISTNLIRGQDYVHSPAVLYIAAVSGGIGIIGAIWGIVSTVFSIEIPKVTLVLDCLSSFLLLAMGLVFAINLKARRCKLGDLGDTWMLDNKIINAGDRDGEKISGQPVYWHLDNRGWYEARCRAAGADAAFMFIGFFSFALVVAWGLIKGKKSGESYVV